MRSLQFLLSELVDYAGLFPPAALSLPSVVENYRDYLASDRNWMLGRLVLPLGKLSEFAETAGSLDLPPTRISLLPPPADDPAFEAAMDDVCTFNQAAHGHRIDSLEVRVSDAHALKRLQLVPDRLRCFVELPPDRCSELLPALGAANDSRLFAKIRTGGVTPDLIPPPETVARFLIECKAAGLGLKATAGLHHPVRSEYPLTYEPGCPRGVMHGFLNVFVTAAIIDHHAPPHAAVVDLLETTAAASFQFTEDSICVADFRVSAENIAATRQSFAVSFGSCSFTEPVDDLVALNLLPEPPHASD